MNKVELSIVTTMYYSAPYIEEFYTRISKSAKKITDNYEIIFVNDGSPDNSLETSLELQQNDKKVKIIDLSRNFGHHKAVMTGLANAEGGFIFYIDLDLEEYPELLELFWKELKQEKDTDVIFGVQKKRKGGIVEKLSGALFFDLFNFFSYTKIPKNLIMARLMTIRYVKNLIKHKERELVFAGLCAITGFRQKPIVVKKHSKGSTTYGLRKKINLAINFIASFSSKPLVFIFYLGLFITILSFVFVLFLAIKKIFFNVAVGWTSLIASIWFVGGLTIFSIGIIGIYLSKIFIEVKQRPFTIIKEKYGFDE